MQTFKLSGLTCPACKKLIEKRVAAIAGVTSVNVNQDTGETTLESSRDIESLEIIKALRDTPYQVIN